MSNDLRSCIYIWSYVTDLAAPSPPHVIVLDDEEPIGPAFQDHEEDPKEVLVEDLDKDPEEDDPEEDPEEDPQEDPEDDPQEEP
ncbi:hypothetical protein E3N88_28383 [Mikania micrantha]|uniref:Uncharacterized protein n=1 Tax=Mikania micrantha TaxID=192012 RepID=A0A5N6N2B4_9ASTR|nr:hypothetical protein E3N88_28383 [Mikania micrantha]